ncbi:MAG: Ig-like domain-containing protein [Muribaculaceae bacterium]|nr:Ig-like domain-containing protein [Muribaculaceae bacterium]
MISKKHISVLGGALAMLLLMWGCASMGNPSGGPRDEDPPRFVRAIPSSGSVNVDPSNIYLDFNELINVKDAFQKVILSPPGKSTPRVSTRGRRVVVNITDTLLPNTTYTIDFGDAIEDNNEGNKLPGFAYTFSTGPTLDSLRIGGMVLGAEDMEPQQGVLVGAYISREDSAFIRMPFERLSRTDEYGRFIIRGLQDTTYRLFALKDLDNDRHYANPEEDIAWFDDIIRPSAERITVTDTVRDFYTGALDTVIKRERTRYLPNNVLLRMYNTGLKPQYLVSYTRPDSTRLEFIFNSPGEKQPRIMIADDEVYSSPLKAESSVGNDTLTFWLPKDLAMRDTLKLALRYPSVELLTGIESMIEDTVKLIKPKPAVQKKKSKKKTNKKGSREISKDQLSDTIANDSAHLIRTDSLTQENAAPTPTFAFTAKGPENNMRSPLSIEVPVPLASLDSLAFRLEMRPDTVWLPVKGDYRVERADTLSERRFMIQYPWERGMNYRLTADSLAGKDIYGVESARLEYEFKTKAPEDLSSLKLRLNGLDRDIPAFVQLLASGDKPKYSVPVVNGVAMFEGIDPGKYYARIYEDFDGDGRYSPGSYRLQKVFGTPVDSLVNAGPTAINDSIPEDSVAGRLFLADTPGLRADSLNIPVDSIFALPADSTLLAEKVPVVSGSGFRYVGDRQIVDSLKRIGYSLVPIETDSVGQDILIAIQPDYVYYYPKIINVKKNWDVEQEWNVFDTALDLQKPEKIKKNKPKNNKNRQQQQEEDEEEDDEFGANPFAPGRTNSGSSRGTRNMGRR